MSAKASGLHITKARQVRMMWVGHHAMFNISAVQSLSNEPEWLSLAVASA